MKKLLLILAVAMLTVEARAQLQSGTNVRGAIQTSDPYSNRYIPLSGASVILYLYHANTKKYDAVSKTITNSSGYYFFYNIAPGNYYIRVNNAKNYSVTVGRANASRQFQELTAMKY